MFDIVALGEILIDFTPSGVNEQGMTLFARNPGGAPANVLAMAGRLGKKTAFIGKVGTDAFGDFLCRILTANGIDTVGLARDPEIPTTLAIVQLDERGDRSFTFYRKPGADMMLSWQEMDRQLPAAGRVFHFGSVSLTDDPSREATLRAAACAKEAGCCVSFDPNYRAPLWQSAAQARETIQKGVALADLLKVSDEELTFLTGEGEIEAGAAQLLEQGPALVLVSLGERGCYYHNAVTSGYLPGYRVNAVDTTGAGDAFLGAVLSQLGGAGHEELAQMTKEQLEAVLRFANAAGALTTTRGGAIPAMPTEEQIKNLIAAER